MKAGHAPSGVPLGNFLSLGAGEVAARCVAFFATALLARRLGVEGFGILGFASALTSYLIIVPNVGLNDLAAREVAGRPGEAARIASGVVRLQLLLAFAGLALICGLALVLPKPPIVRALVALSALSLFPLALNTGWAYKALGRARPVGVGLVLAQLVYAGGVLLAVRDPEDLLRVPLVQAAGELASACLLIPLVRGSWRLGSLREGAQTLRGAGTITFGRLLRAIIVTSDVLLLSFLADDRQVGLYSAAYRVCFLLTAIALSAHVVFLPALAQARHDPLAGSEVLGRSLWLSGTVALPLVVGGVLVAPDLLAWLFGPAYRAGGDAFRLLLASIGLLFLHGTLRNVFLVRNRLRLEAALIGLAAGVNVTLNLLLIPRYGIQGTAFVMVITEGLILLAGAVVVRQWGWRPPLRPLVRPLTAAAAMGTLLFVTPGQWHVALRIGLGGLAYGSVLALVGGLPPMSGAAFSERISRADPSKSPAKGDAS